MADSPEAFRRLLEIMARLRGPDGCPWDKEQTHRSLVPYLIEEAYEVVDAIEHRGPTQLRDELGDLMLQVIFHAQIARERGAFTIDDVVQGCADKLTKRHPHVFQPARQPGHTAGLSSQEVLDRWEANKRREQPEEGSVMNGLPARLPALAKARKVQARAAGVGFDWARREDVLAKVEEEVGELRQAVENEPHRIADELGDLFFTLVNVARRFNLDAESALRRATTRFTARFAHMERAAGTQALEGMSPDEWDRLWEAAKAAEAES